MSHNNQDREPWLSVNLNWIQSGLGQIYAGQKQWGLTLLITDWVLLSVAVWQWLSQQGNARLGAGLFGAWLILKAYVLFDAFLSVRQDNSIGFETNRRKERDGWLGIYLNQLLPGLGHLYLNRFLSGLLFLGLSAAAYWWAVPQLEDSPLSPMAIHCLSFAIYVALVLISIVSASANNEVSKGTNTQLLLIVLLCLFLFSLKSDLARRLVLSSYYPVTFDSRSARGLAPNILPGDRVWGKMLTRYRPHRSDLVFYASPAREYHKQVVHRVVAKSGEKVQIDSTTGRLIIDGKLYDLGIFKDLRYTVTGRFGTLGRPYTVPNGYIFVLGDDSAKSIDSRHYGAVPESSVGGIAHKIAWPISRIGNL